MTKRATIEIKFEHMKQEPLNIVINALREVVKRCGVESYLGSLAQNALVGLEESPPTTKQWLARASVIDSELEKHLIEKGWTPPPRSTHASDVKFAKATTEGEERYLCPASTRE